MPMAESRHNLRRPESAANDVQRSRTPLANADEGERLLQHEGLRGLHDALTGTQASGTAGWVHFWRGYALQFDDLVSARAQWLLAESCFERERDAPGLELVACGLVQCAMLDNLSYVGLDERAARIAAPADAAAAEATPLALFRTAAWLLLAAERREAMETVGDDIEHAFAALGLAIEPEITLRVATAALPMLGLGLDRVRGGDFFQAGAAVAASPRMGDYSRALWHLFVVEARFYDATWTARLHGELDAIDRLAPTQALRPLQARAHILRAGLALGAGEVAAGRASLDAAHPMLHPSHPRDYWTFHYYSSRHALMIGAAEDAWDHAKTCERRQIEERVPESGRTAILMQQGFVLVALGRFDDAVATFARAGDLSRGAQATPCLVHTHLTRALRHWRAGVRDEARAELTAGFAQARSIDLTHFFRALPAVAAQLCGTALSLEADVAFARKVIAARSLVCPDIGIAQWPWPLRVRSLGGFAIERDGEPFKFGRKAPKRLLDVLRLVAALGGRQVDSGGVAATLWPDAQGDEARAALKAMLHRARTLLGPDWLLVRDGQISLDDRTVWVDTWAFDHVSGRIESLLLGGTGTQRVDDGELECRRLQLFALYRGHFLGEGEVPAWAIAVRDRWRERFIRSARLLGKRCERTGRPEEAITLYRAALEQDNLAEELYQHLIECHLARGEHAQALNAYRRCRELLSIVLGLKPSAGTEALVARIAGR
jgi:DNA-binding SARP family transcriptional activator